jgi:hypothetical protein
LRTRIFDAEGTLLVERDHPPLEPAGVPLRLDEASLEGAWNLPLPGELIQRGTAIQVVLLPHPDDPDPRPKYFPGPDRTLPLKVLPAPPPLKVTLFPMLCRGRKGVVEDTRRTLASWGGFAGRIFPVAELDLKQGPAFTVQLGAQVQAAEGVDTLLEMLRAKRLQDPPEPGGARRYFGVFADSLFADPQFGGLSYLGRPGRLSTKVSIGWDHQDVNEHLALYDRNFAHELGHGLGLQHAFADGEDGATDYPHAESRIGVSGFDVGAGRPVPSRMKDVMSYFAGHALWISDYHWTRLADLLKQDAAPEPQAPGAGSREPALMVWGQVQGGQVLLRPALRVPGENACPPQAGPYTLVGLDRTGRTLVQASFNVGGRAGSTGSADGTFLFTLPLAPSLERALATLRVLGPRAEVAAERHARFGLGSPPRALSCLRSRADTAVLDWDAQADPLVTVKDIQGQTLAMGWESPLELETAAGELELCFSDGVRTRVQRVPVR